MYLMLKPIKKKICKKQVRDHHFWIGVNINEIIFWDSKISELRCHKNG